MEKFIVSARKYRPQNFNSVIGQQHITTTLKNAIIHNQLAHAFLFCGPRGVGKTSCARILAKTINCPNKTPEGEACNQCNSCVSFDLGTSLNIHELDAASNNSVDDIRNLVDQVRFAPQAGQYKVYIVDEVHMLSAAAFNAFLKTLEEPPPYAIFILATTEKHKILPTIISRCQLFDFKRITNNDTVEHLQEIVAKESIKADKAALQLIAQKSEGCMRDSLSILDKIVSFTNGAVTYSNTIEHLNILDEDYYFKLMDALLLQQLADALLLYDEINRKGFEGDLVLSGFAEFIRNLMVCKDPKAAMLLDVVEGLQIKYQQKSAEIGLGFLVSALNVLNDAELQFNKAKNKRLHVELCLIKLCFLQQALELATKPNGEIIQKLRVDGPIAYRQKLIPTPGAKKQKETPIAELPAATLLVKKTKEPITANAVEAYPAQNHPVSVASEPPPTNGNLTSNLKKNLLQALKEKHQTAVVETQEVAQELIQNRVEAVWKNYSEQCRQKQMHHVANSFDTAQLHIIDSETIEVQCPSTLNQKILEIEKVELIQQLQKEFCNKKIQLQFTVTELEEPNQPTGNQHLNSHQRFQLIAEQYPLLNELKQKLRLEIDY